MIIDSHCHLDLLEKKGANIDEIVQNAKDHGVLMLQTICTKISEIENILKFSQKYDNIYASIGNHPCNVKEEGVIAPEQIIEICQKHPKIIGIGETGLDYYYESETKAAQKQSFLNHIAVAQTLQKPLIIHSRDCDADMIEILKSEQKNQKFPALLHCFCSGGDLAKIAIDLGIFISFSGILTFKNARDLQEIAKNVPLDMCLVETDSPYLAPTPFRGKTNEPAYTKYVVDFLAQLKNTSAQEVARVTTDNFCKLFNVEPLQRP